MEAEYLCRLGDATQDLVKTIEERIQDEIQIEIDERRKETLTCEVDKCSVKIFLPSCEYFPEPSVVHELIRIRRFCVDRVPKLIICEAYEGWNPQDETILIKLDNDIEHLNVVPEEIYIFPERILNWEEKINGILDQVVSNTLALPIAQSTALVQWVFLHHAFPQSKLLIKADKIVGNLGITEIVSECYCRIKQHIDQKEKLARVFFDYLSIALDSVCLEYLDCRNQTSEEVALASIEI